VAVFSLIADLSNLYSLLILNFVYFKSIKMYSPTEFPDKKEDS